MGKHVNRNRRSHANRVRDLAQQKRNKKHADEIRIILLSLQILVIVAAISALGFYLDNWIMEKFEIWNFQYYIAAAFLVLSIVVAVWYAVKKFSKNKNKPPAENKS